MSEFLFLGHRTSKPVSRVNPCTCPGDAEQPAGVVLEAWNEGDDTLEIFLGGGDSPEAAHADAEDHAYAALGEDAVTGWDWPA
jgi:hypothetical protein